ncbi:MAG: hypothetical protein FJ098_16130, partial [Deltaproteobacteria bacterium]|nr:hypothetical protein [Deltaproteobacteria bacterium]
MRRTTLVTLGGAALILWLSAALPACDGGTGTGGSTDPMGTEDGIPENDAAADDLVREEDPGPECPASLILELFNATSPLILEVDREYALQARVYNPLTGETPAGEPVTFTLSGDGDASITGGAVDTDAFGVATVTFLSGTQAPATYGLSLRTPCAEEVEVVLEVQPHATGSIVVTVVVGASVERPGDIASLRIHVSHAGTLCAALDPADPPADMALHELPAGESQLLLEDAVAGPGYTIMAVGVDGSGAPVAAGCTQGVNVYAGKQTETEVSLEALHVSPAGTYLVTLSPDFGALVAGYPEGWSLALVDALEGAPDDVKQAVIEGIAKWFDDGVLPEECGDVAGELGASVDAWAQAHLPPPWLPGLEAPGASLQDLLEDPEIGASLVVEGGAFGGACSLALDITSVTFHGEVGCAGEDCGTFPFGEDELETGEAWLKAEDSETGCQVTAANELLLEAFSLHLNPGRLLLFAWVNVVLPGAAEGATSVLELFEGHYDCEAMVAGVQDSTLTCLNRPRSALVEDCEAAVSAALGPYLAL